WAHLVISNFSTQLTSEIIKNVVCKKLKIAQFVNRLWGFLCFSDRIYSGTMDHVLRTASSIFAQLGGPANPSTAKELLDRTTAFIQIVESSPCAHQLPKYDTNVVRLQINDLQREAAETGSPLTITNYFTIVVRKMIEQVLQVFCKIIARYLTECGNKDRLVLIALEHLIHLVLFGDDLCLEAIQSGALHSVLKLVRQASTPPETNKLLLRALAVLCAVSKGCLSLLALGGLEVVLSHLTGNHVGSSIEAAGVLTQLTNPQHSYVQLQNIGPILVRLLDLIDECTTGETLLLVSAALANVSLQDPAAIDLLYRHNAIIRLINAYNRQECSTIFVQEQVGLALSSGTACTRVAFYILRFGKTSVAIYAICFVYTKL
ncbi:unnamed protein product, partial [Haemonchus placei]|uniref:Insc_C domain-containing protein n=1 Tax=Haemonchus placei TaxID=6290 RepID=A0A0N4X1A6_HAEPC